MLKKEFFNKELLEKLQFQWEDLHGKTLKICSLESIDGIITSGVDEDGHIYVLDIQINKENK